MYRILLLIPFLFAITNAGSQPAPRSTIQQFTTDNGLPSNGIKGLSWDEQTGFLWIATEAGIVRYNGVGFRYYSMENMPSIGSERMLFMQKNHSDSIYISDVVGNIFRIDKNKPVLWKGTEPNTNPYFDNYHLLAVSDTFFMRFKDVNKQRDKFSAVTDKVMSRNDTSYLILNAGSLYYQHIGISDPVLYTFLENKIASIFKIDQQCFINTNDQKIFLLNTRNQTIIPFSVSDEQGNDITNKIKPTNLFWQQGMQFPIMILGENAMKFTFDGKQVIARQVFSGIPRDAFIRTVQYSEKNKILFIATDSKGLIVISQNRVDSKKRSDINPQNRNAYYSQVELADGNILTNEGDIIGDNLPSTALLPIQDKFAFTVSETNDSLLWYFQFNKKLGYSCLHRTNKITGRTKVFDKIVAESVLTGTMPDVYMANINGIYKLVDDSFRALITYPVDSTKFQVFDLLETEPGILALATCRGLLRFNIASSKLDTIFYSNRGCVRTIWKYGEHVFFGTYGAGFYAYKNGKVVTMPLDKNRYLSYTHCFAPDKNGFCWLSTNRGLFKAKLDELVSAAENKTNTVYYHFFGKKDGMDMTELNGGCTPCALKLKNNMISFPTMDGLLWVDPDRSSPVLPEGEIFIDEIFVDNTITTLSSFSERSLPSKTGEIIIHLAFSGWCNNENIYLEYQLNDTVSWKPVSLLNGSEIRLINLTPGKYNIRIRKMNGFGIDNYTYKQVEFSITKPWNQQWWFYAICILAVVGLVAGYLRFRTNQYAIRQRKLENQVAEKTRELQLKNEVLEKNDTIKTRLISIISHDIVTPLKFLTAAGKNLMEKRKMMPEDLQQETISEMTHTSQELQLLSTNILNWIKYQNENRRLIKERFNLNEMTNQVFSILYSMARQKNITLFNDVDKNMIIYQYFEPLKILVYNLVSNAINFSESGKITVSGKINGNSIYISVKDQGVGMTAEQVKNILADEFIISSTNIDKRKGNGLGYLIIKDLLKTMDGKLKIESEKNTGTEVTIILPYAFSSRGIEV